MIQEDPTEEAWPDAIRVGAGAQGFALLKDVPVWYELWRQINGFPPDYYTSGMDLPMLEETGGKKTQGQ